MFNYTKEVIINKLDDAFKFDSENGVIIIPRVGNYKVANILDSKYYKTSYKDGEAGKVEFKLTSATPQGDIFRLTMFLATPNVQFAEFGTPCWEDFGKPIIVEVGVKNLGDATVADKLADAIKLAAGEYVTVEHTAKSDTLVVKGKELWMDFQDVTLADIVLGKGDVIDEEIKAEYIGEKNGAVVDITKAVAEFGTYDYLVHNLRFPTAPNLRFAPLNADELPVRGARYNQYVFKYVARHNVPGGLSGVDQCVDSITSHVFFVADDLKDTFEGQIKTAAKLAEVNVDTKFATDGGYKDLEPSMNPYAELANDGE